MAVVNITEGWTGCDAGGDSRVRRATRVFTVFTDSAAERGVFTWPLEAGSVRIPAPDEAHPDDAELRSQIPLVTKAHPCVFEVKVPYQTYDPLSAGGLPISHINDPLSAPAEISWGNVRRQVATDRQRDAEGSAIVNSNGRPFNPPAQIDIYDMVMVIERNQAAWNLTDQGRYIDTVSSQIYQSFPAGVPRLVDMAAKRVQASTPYWRSRFEVHFRFWLPPGVDHARAWNVQALNQDSWYVSEDLPERQLVPTAHGEMTPLTAEGYRVYSAKTGLKIDGRTEHWIDLVFFETRDWSPLGLP